MKNYLNFRVKNSVDFWNKIIKFINYKYKVYRSEKRGVKYYKSCPQIIQWSTDCFAFKVSKKNKVESYKSGGRKKLIPREFEYSL